MKPKIPVSVIIPHHDRPEKVALAIESVAAQTFQPLEIIIVDDASRRAHREKLSRFSNLARIIALGTNVGPAEARNVGVESARGEMLAFLDDDDEWTADKLERQWRVMAEDEKIDAVTSAVTVIDTNTGAEIGIYHKRSSDRISLATALEGTPAMIQTMLIRTAVMKALGGFDRRLRQLEDYDFFIRLVANGAFVMHCSDALARLHRRSADHLTNHRWGFLRSQLMVVNKHHSLFAATLGPDAARIEKSKHIRRAGIRQGGIRGRSLYAVGCVVGSAYTALSKLLTTGAMTEVPYSPAHS